uniref:Uncharacterized protein n=1 Tax=Siphoviridae sp. ctsYA13 TaxID=2825695 RepID=A0A8S5VBR0_9CAUD|nr:MAG TPA: hypothetical protein [Siphoviridae sp. ctsYA13]
MTGQIITPSTMIASCLMMRNRCPHRTGQVALIDKCRMHRWMRGKTPAL